MSDGTSPALPPLPPQPASDAARATAPAHVPVGPAYDPATDPDDTGVPSISGLEVTEIGRGFFRALFDLSFRTFITRRLASAFYAVGLVAIAMGFLVWFVLGITRGILALAFSPGAGIALLVATIIVVPIAAFLSIVILRFVIEGLVALIAIAENTERTAANTRR